MIGSRARYAISCPRSLSRHTSSIGAHPAHKFAHETKKARTLRPWPGVLWSRQQDSNLQQAVYKTATLPLRHAGTLITRLSIVRENASISKRKIHRARGIFKGSREDGQRARHTGGMIGARPPYQTVPPAGKKTGRTANAPCIACCAEHRAVQANGRSANYKPALLFAASSAS